jgi:peroxiredoxin Q/BCP
MVSLDAPERNADFSAQKGAGFPVLSDPSGASARSYGVLGAHGLARRWTFTIDAEGVIRDIDRDVDPRTEGRRIARRLRELGIPKRKEAAR